MSTDCKIFLNCVMVDKQQKINSLTTCLSNFCPCACALLLSTVRSAERKFLVINNVKLCNKNSK